MKKTYKNDEIIFNFPLQLIEGLKLSLPPFKKRKFQRIILCGMGGSGLAGEILSLFFKNKGISFPLIIWKNYFLPKDSTKDDLIIVISYSGNTEEAISSFKEATKKRFRVLAISSGGILEKLAFKKKIPYIKIPPNLPPRLALGYLLLALLLILEKINFLKLNRKEIISAGEKLFSLRKKLSQEGKKLAKTLLGKIPLIYSSEKNRALAMIWKISFNENSKIQSFFNVFPELNHNEMTGFMKPLSSYFIVALLDEDDYQRIKKRFRLTLKILKRYKIKSKIFLLKGNFFFKIFKTILLAIWTSYHLALLYKIDPFPVELVEEFKRKLK